MKLLNSYKEIDIEEYNLSYELQYAKYIMELFSYELTFVIDESSKLSIYRESGKKKEKITDDAFIYYIQVYIDGLIQEYVMKLNGKVIDLQIKKDVFLNTSEIETLESGVLKRIKEVPEKYKDDKDLNERYQFYLKHILTYIKTRGKDEESASILRKVYGSSYTDIRLEELEKDEQKYKSKLSSFSFLVEILENLMIVKNIRTLLDNMRIYLINTNTFN